MVCVAAFIILLAIWLFTPIMKLLGFKKQAKAVNSMFKKSMHCFTRRVTLRACDSNFKDDIKNMFLRKLIVKHKKWVKPVSFAIEALAWVIVVISVWSVLTIIKSALAFYAYGTCNIQQPDSCALNGSEACTIDGSNGENAFVRWFTEWGDLVSAVPARMREWNAQDYVVENSSYYGEFENQNQNSKPAALDIFDPGCVICRNSFRNQLQSGFFEKHRVYALPYVIRDENGKSKFENSELVSRYVEAVRGTQPAEGKQISPEWYLLEKVFVGTDNSGVSWQENFNGVTLKAYSAEKVEAKIAEWLKEAGYSSEQIEVIAKRAKSDEVSKRLEATSNLVQNEIRTIMIPTMIFDGRRHDGLFKLEN
ncbi:MAG: hypothetical protein Q4A27_03485 [bacterium]|nr:hypothetical protein [bacterium]